MSVQILELAPEILQRLDRLCRGLGAHRLTALAPGARSPSGSALPQRLTSEWRRIWTFASPESAERWNQEWERVLLSRERLHSALVSLRGAPIPEATLDVVARIAATILGEDVRSGVPIPEVDVAWRYELVVSHAYQGSPSSWSRDSLVVTLVGTLFDAEGVLRWSSEARREYPLDELPEGTAIALTRRPWIDTAETYQAA